MDLLKSITLRYAKRGADEKCVIQKGKRKKGKMKTSLAKLEFEESFASSLIVIKSKNFLIGSSPKKKSKSCQAGEYPGMAYLFEVAERVGTVFTHFSYQRHASYQDSYKTKSIVMTMSCT